MVSGVQLKGRDFKKRWAVHAVEPAKRNESVVSAAASAVADAAVIGERWRPKVEEEAEDYEKLAAELENASPLEIMDRALAKFGNDIAIAFRFDEIFFFSHCF